MASRYLVDTSSLLSLVRYYLYFDDDKILYNKIQDVFKSGQCILLESVKEEADKVAKGIVLKELDFLETVTVQENISIEHDLKLNRIIDNNWTLGLMHKKVVNGMSGEEEKEYFEMKADEVYGADFQLVFTAKKMEWDTNLIDGDPIIVTEESSNENDGKVFKKIPQIANTEGIECINLSEMLKQLGIQI